ncbi:hypothetical protein ACI79P_14660 [Blastococcus sp. SYSU DS0510]
MGRTLRKVVLALFLSSTMLVSACSAGQVTQTATQQRDKTGGFGTVGDVTIRAAKLAYPPEGIYRPGDQAELSMAIVNSGQEDDELLAVAGDFFTGVTVTGTPSATETAPAVPSETVLAAQRVEAEPVSAPSTDATGEVRIPVLADEAVYVGMGGPSVVLTGLTEAIDAAQSKDVTLTFARAGQVTVRAIVAPAPEPLPREPVIGF